MPRLPAPAKIVLLALLAFALAAGVGATSVPDSYVLALLVSVGACPALLGFVGGRWLSLGAAGTLVAIDGLPFLMALDQRLHLHQPAGFGWLALSLLPAWAGWRVGCKAAAPEAAVG
ncbi:MAG: hypothetical protein ACHQ49_02475 [Elusimicrobiota bacterium]